MESPLLAPPPGFKSDFTNTAFVGLPVLVTVGVCIPLVLVSALVRIHARIILKEWCLHDYLYCLGCSLGISYLAFIIVLANVKLFGHNVWDIDANSLPKTSLSLLYAMEIFTGPVLLLSKATIFGFLIRIFKPTKWFQNSAYFGILVTGLVFSTYTCVVSLACSPKPESDIESYVHGFKRNACSSPNGANLIFSVAMGSFDCLTNVCLLAAALLLQSGLGITTKQARLAYVIHFTGSLAWACSVMGIAYRVKMRQHSNITGYQIQLTIAIVLEVTLSLMIPAMPSFYDVWRYYTRIDIIEQIPIVPYNSGPQSPISFYESGTSTPTIRSSGSRDTWRKTHTNIQELPYRKSAFDYCRSGPLEPSNSRMKALPATPFPAPNSPHSVRSMRLPIIMESNYR